MKRYILIPIAVAVLAVAGAIYVGVITNDGTVADEPYEEGLRWDADRKAAAESGLNVNILTNKFIVGEQELAFRIVDSKGDILGENVVVKVERPSSASYNNTYHVGPGQDGVHRARIVLPLVGHWDINFIVHTLGREITFKRSVYAEESK